MKDLVRICVLFLFGMLLTACAENQAKFPGEKDAGDFAKWDAWSIIWQHAQTFDDVTVTIEDKQKTYLPKHKNYVFLAMKAEMLNISNETQEMRFWQGPVYLTDANQSVYDMVGLAHDRTIMMAPPYLLVDKTSLTTAKWEDGRFFLVAYQHDPQSWFIQATPNSLFHVDFLFAIPRGMQGFVLHFGNGMIVNIQ